LVAYLLLTAILYFREDSLTYTFTNSLRQVFYLIIDVLLPYFVISRSLKNLQSFRDALLSLVLAIMVLAPMAFFEFAKSWLLYQSLGGLLDLKGGMTNYLGRDGMIRALVSTGQAIALGYVMVVGIGIYLFIQRSIHKKFIRRLGMAVLFAGLIAPLSRGPWVGAVVLFVVFIATGRYAIRRLLTLTLSAMLALPLVSILPGGERAINLLPFIGTTEKFNVDYRENLITNSMIVIARNPWFGSTNFMETPEMEAMRQGEGIIDIVNSYLGITLETGWVGVSLFVSFFVLTLWGIYSGMRSIPDGDSEEYLLGRALLATQLSIMVMIFTVSSITVIPIVYWAIAGVGVGYAQMVKRKTV
jgi:O-antigen ligase